MTGLGIATGDLIHTLYAEAGLSAILMTSAQGSTIVQFLILGLIFVLMSVIYTKIKP